MITSSFSLTATERVLPKLALDFTTANLDSRVTFIRTTNATNPATYTNSSGVLTLATNNQPRFDYDPVTLACKGLLIEESRTNLLLNSLIDGTTLSTQIVMTAATPYTLSFYGTGTITLSGTTTNVVSGIGVYPSRKTYTFTPTAGALTCTVTGTVQFAQLEAGAFATSYIPTEATALTRNADVATMTGTNFSSWYNSTEGSIEVKGIKYVSNAVADAFSLVAAGTNIIRIGTAYEVFNAGSAVVTLYGATASTFNSCASYKTNNYAFGKNGVLIGTDTLGTVPTAATTARFDSGVGTYMNGWIQKLNYWPQALLSAECTAFSK